MSNQWTDKDTNRIAASLKALGSPIRLSILCVLSRGECAVQDLVAQLGDEQPSNLSRHLTELQNRNILKSRRDGSRILYRIATPEIENLLASVEQVFCR